MSELRNYFNYFTEIEEHFQKARGTSLFLLSPLDWALIESWKVSDIPLEAVLRGIDAVFDKWRAGRSKTKQVNSLAFCTQEVMAEAQRTPGVPTGKAEPDSFPDSEIAAFLQSNLVQVREREGFEEIAASLGELLLSPFPDLEELDRRLTVVEERMIAIARSRETERDSLAARRELDSQLQPYRRKMTAPQLAMLERQFLERKLLEQSHLPRLSLFYLR